MSDAIDSGGAPGTVLIVDDTALSAAALELACSGIPGMEVKSVSSAQEAVRILDDPNTAVRAVLTDIRMPAMDGFDLICFIRSHRRHIKMPVIVVTADTDPETPERASRLGANAFFGKPFSPRAVRRTLEDLLYVDVGSE
ncbi:MAG: response regulator [Bryobacteraceae bacterium]|jgi:CheY-like chemotaxis protein